MTTTFRWMFCAVVLVASVYAQAANQGQMHNDPGTVAARKCVEAGGNELECIGKGLKVGIFDLAGVNLPKEVIAPGLRMTGVYGEAAGVEFEFDDDSLSLRGCGKLVIESHKYTLQRNASGLKMRIENAPQPLNLVLRQDGMLIGPGLVSVRGQVITGYQRNWVEKRLVEDNSVVPGSGHYEYVPILAPKVERCMIGALRATRPTQTLKSVAEGGLNILAGQTPQQATANANRQLIPPGLRMAGTYAGGGMRLEFETEAALVECGEAHILQPYEVVRAGQQIVVKFPKNEQPFSLSLTNDKVLTGVGTVAVSGRVVTGQSPNGGIAYAPRTGQCALTTLSADVSGASSGIASTAGPAGAASGGARQTSAGPNAGTAKLDIKSGFKAPTRADPNPLSGNTLFLMKDSFANILAKLGVQPVAGSRIKGWGATCNRREPACAQGNAARQNFVVTQTIFSTDGDASIEQVPPGTYYLFGWTVKDGHHLVWDVKVDLRPGASAITLGEANAEVAD